MNKEAKIKTEDIIKAINTQPPVQFDDCTLVGGNGRPNSWTFKLSSKEGKHFMLKVLKATVAKDDELLNNEELALESIKSRSDINAVKIIKKGTLRLRSYELSYLLFPFIEGPDLSKLLARQSHFTEAEVLQFIKDTSDTIAKLAEVGLIHQDIKPANIIKQGDDTYLLLDLGIARFLEDDYKLFKQQGPAKYLSPEQVQLGFDRSEANQRTITFLSDIYSLGVVALEMIATLQFTEIYKVDDRKSLSKKIRDNNIINISDDNLRLTLAAMLEHQPSTRLIEVSKCLPELIDSYKKLQAGLPAYWTLQYSSSGNTIIERFASDNPNIKGGVVLLAEHINSEVNNLDLSEKLQLNGWQVAVDPSTHKLFFHSDHFAYLKSKSYYHSGLKFDHFLKPRFATSFVNNVIEFQRAFKPNYFISPYLYIKDPDSTELDLTINLYEEAKYQLKDRHDTTPLFLGLALSSDLIRSPAKLSRLLDQLILLPEITHLYIKAELKKSDNSPCKDKEYLQGLLCMVETLTKAKTVLLSQVDQAALGLFSRAKLSIAINPVLSVRKNDIGDKLTRPQRSGGPAPEDRRVKLYYPRLLNDFDISREISNTAFQKVQSAENLQCTCQYCKGRSSDLLESSDRNLHFMATFAGQLHSITSKKGSNRKTEMQRMIDDAGELYSKLERTGIILDEASSSSFLVAWEEVFGVS